MMRNPAIPVRSKACWSEEARDASSCAVWIEGTRIALLFSHSCSDAFLSIIPSATAAIDDISVLESLATALAMVVLPLPTPP